MGLRRNVEEASLDLFLSLGPLEEVLEAAVEEYVSESVNLTCS